jgi:hypothetical protein
MNNLRKLVVAAFCLAVAMLTSDSAHADPPVYYHGDIIAWCSDMGGDPYEIEGCNYGPGQNLCVWCCSYSGGEQCYYAT